MGLLKPWLGLDAKRCRYAIQLCVGTQLALLLTTVPTLRAHLNSPQWAVMTVIVVATPTLGEATKKCLLRVVGTVLGGALGYAITSLLYWASDGDFVDNNLWIYFHLLVLPPTFFVAYWRPFYKQYDYAFMLVLMTMDMLTAYHFSSKDPNHVFYLSRIGMVIVGVIIGWLVSLLVFPNRASTQLHLSVHNMLSAMADVVTGLIDLYRIGLDKAGREAMLGKMGAVRAGLEEQKTLLANAVEEYKYLNIGKDKDLAGVYEDTLLFSQRIFFTLCTMYYLCLDEPIQRNPRLGLNHAASLGARHSIGGHSLNSRLSNRGSLGFMTVPTLDFTTANTVCAKFQDELVQITESIRASLLCLGRIVDSFEGTDPPNAPLRDLYKCVGELESGIKDLRKKTSVKETDIEDYPDISDESLEDFFCVVALTDTLLVHFKHAHSSLASWAVPLNPHPTNPLAPLYINPPATNGETTPLLGESQSQPQ